MRGRHSRRDVLSGIGLLGTATLAGCLGSDGDNSTETETGSSGPTYPQWLPEPEQLGGEDWHYNHYNFFHADLVAVRDNEASFDDELVSDYRSMGDAFPLASAGLAFEDATEPLTMADGIQMVFEAEDVTASLESNGYEHQTDYEGYQIYDMDDAAIGVDSGTVIGVPWGGSISPSDFEAIIRTIVDSKAGSAERYRQREDYDRLVEALGTGTFVNGTTTERYEAEYSDPEEGELSGTVATGKNVIVDGPDTTIRHVRVLESEDDVDMEAVDEWMENGYLTEKLANKTSEQRDRVVIVEGTRRTGEYGLYRYID
jgi:hypothetical protein